MSSMEQKSEIRKRKSNLEIRFSQQYESLTINSMRCFRKRNGEIFAVSKFPGSEALVVEFADSYEDANLHRFEDGDLFYLRDLDEQAMFDAMVREIES